MFASKKTGPRIGMSPSPGILSAPNVLGEFSVFWYGTRRESYKNPVRPRISRLITTPSTIWSTR